MDMADFLMIHEDPLSPVLDARIYVQPRDKGDAREFTRQMALVNWLRRHAPKIIVFAIPNATRGDWSKIRQQREGAIYGAPDLCLTWPTDKVSGGIGGAGCAFIEMKDGAGKPEDRQIEFLNRLARQGHHVAVCRSLDAAVTWLHSVGAPVPRITGGGAR
jgi:hypothetical protein